MLKQRIRGEILEAYLADNAQARILQPDGKYVYADALRSRSGSPSAEYTSTRRNF